MKKLSTHSSLSHVIFQSIRTLLLLIIGLCSALSCFSQWQPAVSNTTETLNDVGYNNGQWVAVGVKGTIVSSSDGITWTPRNSNTIQTLNAITYGGGQWMVVGNYGTILTSLDGVNWTFQSVTITQHYYAVAYGGGMWVVTGTGGLITSSDGITWTTRTTGPNILHSVSYGSGIFVAVGENKAIFSSSDGVTWTSQFAAFPGSGICQCFPPNLFAIAFNRQKFVVVGGYGGLGSVATSTDGTNWTIGSGTQQSGNISYGAGLWLAFSMYGTIHTSTDGLTWSSRYSSSRQQYIYKSNYGGGMWVAVGVNGNIQYTADVNTPLPVSLTSFQGQTEASTIHLSWETAWEKGASHFLIERSSDAKSFEPIGKIQAQGTTSTFQHYNFLDKELMPGIWYYRLRQVDLDNTFTYSQIIAVRIGNEPLETLTLSPNPSSGPLLVEYKNGIKAVWVYSLTGLLIKTQQLEPPADRWIWESVSQPKGLYLIRIQTQDGQVYNLRWVKQ